MTDDMQTACSRELRSFFFLSVANLVFAAMTMAFGLSGVVSGVAGIAGAGGVAPFSLASLALGVVAGVVGIRWVLESAGVLSDVTDLQEEAAARDESGDEDVLRIMIGMMGIYRDRRETVERMILVAKIGGAVFLVLGGLNLATALGGAQEPFVLYGGLVAAALNLGVGGAALFVSRLVGRYRAAWEARLGESAKAEAALTAAMERD